MRIQNLLAALLILLAFGIQAQDKALIKKYLREQIEPSATFGVSYNTGDFMPELQKKKKQEEPSLQKIDQLHDSLRVSYDPESLMRIGKMYNQLNMKSKGKTYLQEAINLYQEKLAKNKDDKDLALIVLTLHIELGQLDKAIEINNELINQYPTDTLFNVMSSFIYLSKGDMKQAIIAADKAIAKFPGNPSIYLYKTCALVFQELGELQSADNFQTAKTEFKDFKSDFSYLDKIPAKVKKNPEIQLSILSNKFFKLFYRIMLPVFFDPPDSSLYYKFKLTAKDSTELALYEKEFISFIGRSDFKNKYTANYSLGVIHVLKNDPESAVAYFKKSIAGKPLEYRDMQDNVVSSYENIISSYVNLGDKVNAEIWTRKKIEEKASVVPLADDYVLLSSLQVLKGDFNSGKENLSKALQIDSAALMAYVQLANVYMLEGDLQSAGYYLETCYQKNPDLPALYNSVLLFRLLQGDKANAEIVLKGLLDYNPENGFAVAIRKDFFTD